MDRIYIYDGYFENGKKGDNLIRKAAESYLMEKGTEQDLSKAEIVRPENGKPFFKDIPVKFSLSHSGIMWMCMFSDVECGLDVQVMTECDYERLSRRYLKKNEIHYVKLLGKEAFFQIWTRREAFGKCTGGGLFSKMPSFVNDNYDLEDELELDGKKYYMKTIEISDDIKCAVCSTAPIEDEMRII